MSDSKCWWCKKFGQIPLRGFTEHGCESITVKYCPLCGKLLDLEEIEKQRQQEKETMEALGRDSDSVVNALKKIRDVESRLHGVNPARLEELDRRIAMLEGGKKRWNQETERLLQMGN